MTKILAIFSPNKNAYSETFIQAHKQLPFNIKFYYGGLVPQNLEGYRSIFNVSIIEKIIVKLKGSLSVREYALLKSLKKQKIDCVLAEYGITAAEVLNVVQYAKISMVVHFHGFDASVKETVQGYAAKYRDIFGYASAVIVVSERMKKAVIEMGCPEQKIVLSYYGPNQIFLSNQPTYQQQQFLAVGRFVEKKAPHLTIFAFANVVKLYPQARLIMVGDGMLLPVCKDLVKNLGLEQYVEFRGVQSPEQVRLLFETSIAFVQHSVVADNGDSEGTPVAVLEAQAAALPVIATYHAGIPDVVLHNTTGFLVEEKDVLTMSEYMIKILKEEGLAKQLGEEGRKRMMENFTIEQHLKQLEDAVKKAVVYRNI
ncbi:MAG: glycosyltransferase [Chitinophagaceae bacterium]|nr:glycosyltransferase [Chitinophagaceae bacterium]MCW5905658.1 glycosyltransferase [Chitinophagaceae bacterium]